MKSKFKIGDRVRINADYMGDFHNAEGEIIDIIDSIKYPFKVRFDKMGINVFAEKEMEKIRLRQSKLI